MGRRTPQTDLVDALAAQAAPLAEELADAVAEATPSRWRAVMDAECRPLTRTLVPYALRRLRAGAGIEEDATHEVRASAARQRREGVPAGTILQGMQGAVERFSQIAAREARGAQLGGLPVVLARAAMISHQFAHAFVVGYLADGRRQPEWAQDLHPVAHETLLLVADGCTTSEIAERLHYSDQAINHHLQRLMRASGAPSRTALVARAFRDGVLAA